jgi:hypothetical protein
MAYSITLPSGAVLIQPDSSIDVFVANNPGGVATSGIIALVGEADEGDSWVQDSANGKKASDNSFGPTDINKVLARYGSGRLVDAFRGLMSPASQGINGSPNRAILIKTNDSSKAQLTLVHGVSKAKRGGLAGNDIINAITSSNREQAASTQAFSYVPSSSGSSMAFRVNGGAKQVLAISANTIPSALAATLTSMSGINVVGGVNRNAIASLTGQNIELDLISGQNVSIKLALGQLFSSAPQVGDTVRIPSGSVIQGALAANVGWYLVTGVSNNISDASITAKKITSGAPVAVAAVAITATPNNDLINYSYMRIDNESGTNRNVLVSLVGQNIKADAILSSLSISLSAGQVFGGKPAVNDLMYIPSGSVVAGGSSENVGWYQVVTVSNSTTSASIKAQRLSNGSPVSVSAIAISATSDVSISDPQIAGLGKALEIYDNAGAVNINTEFKNLGVDSPASWLETLMVSSSELKKTFSTSKDGTNTQESFVVGGDIMMTLGYDGTTASATIGLVGDILKLQTNVVAGSGSNLDIDLSKIATIGQLVSRINQNPGYKAAAASVAAGQQSPYNLDQMTFSIASNLQNMAGRVKNDLWALTKSAKGLAGSVLISYSPIATAGLPEDKAPSYLSGGAKGSTTGLQFSKAVDALQAVRCNFVVPLVSQDASADILTGDTESASTYMVDAVNQACKAHVLSMSTAKVKRHRIAVVSKRGTFSECKTSAQSMASFRVFHPFEDVNDLSASTGNIQTYQPWMAAVKGAGMQAAASYQGIFGPKRVINISAASQAAGDFDNENTSDIEDALLAGLAPIVKNENGTFSWASDQMTYSLDNSEIYNSMQAVYIADLMALSLAESIKKAFIGDSVADVTVGAVESFIKAKMAEFKGLKWTVGTNQFPAGWKSISIDISGSVLTIEVCAIEATTIKFAPISLQIEGIKSSSAA